jgi:hypothetical protein
VGGAFGAFPKTLADLHWQRTGERITFIAGKKQWRARTVGPRIPLRLRASSTQQLNGEWVRVPFEIKGRARLAFSGRQSGGIIRSVRNGGASTA